MSKQSWNDFWRALLGHPWWVAVGAIAAVIGAIATVMGVVVPLMSPPTYVQPPQPEKPTVWNEESLPSKQTSPKVTIRIDEAKEIHRPLIERKDACLQEDPFVWCKLSGGRL